MATTTETKPPFPIVEVEVLGDRAYDDGATGREVTYPGRAQLVEDGRLLGQRLGGEVFLRLPDGVDPDGPVVLRADVNPSQVFALDRREVGKEGEPCWVADTFRLPIAAREREAEAAKGERLREIERRGQEERQRAAENRWDDLAERALGTLDDDALDALHELTRSEPAVAELRARLRERSAAAADDHETAERARALENETRALEFS